MQRNDIN